MCVSVISSSRHAPPCGSVPMASLISRMKFRLRSCSGNMWGWWMGVTAARQKPQRWICSSGWIMMK